MPFATKAQCERRGRIYGSQGEIEYDSKKITVYTFADERVVEHVLPKLGSVEEMSHGGGDVGLARSFVDAVRAVEEEEEEEDGDGEVGVVREKKKMTADEAQRRFVGGDLAEMVRSHAVVFAAEEARRERKVVRFPEWWAEKLAQSGLAS